MIDLELELVSENPSWIAVLKAYQKAQEELAEQQAEAAAKSAQAQKLNSNDDASTGSAADHEKVVEAESDDSETAEEVDEGNAVPRKRASRWVQRVTSLPGIESDELSKIHGRLIAYDLLKCDLAGRSDGMVYQLTSSGKTILGRFGDEALEVDDRSAA